MNNALLLIGASRDVVETRRVVLEGAGFSVHVLAPGERARAVAERIDAALIIIDVRREGPDAEAALSELCDSDEPSSIPVLIIGETGVLKQFSGPARTMAKPAGKRQLLSETHALLDSQRTSWKRRRKA